jgi:hypothetical protein
VLRCFGEAGRGRALTRVQLNADAVDRGDEGAGSGVEVGDVVAGQQLAGLPEGGLFVRLGLRRIGWQVKVLERAAVLDDAGAGQPGTILQHDVYELRTPLPGYVADRVILVGDAAHAALRGAGGERYDMPEPRLL